MRTRLAVAPVGRASRRRGAAAVELCLTAPFLLLMLAVAADFARVFFYFQVLTSCAWNGALFAADSNVAAALPYETAEEAALASAESLRPPPTATVQYGIDETNKPYVELTVSWTFHPLLRVPGMPANMELRRTSRMRVRVEPEEESP